MVELLLAHRNVHILGGWVFAVGVRGVSIIGWAQRYDNKNVYTNEFRYYQRGILNGFIYFNPPNFTRSRRSRAHIGAKDAKYIPRERSYFQEARAPPSKIER